MNAGWVSGTIYFNNTIPFENASMKAMLNNKTFYSSWNDLSMNPEERIKYIIDELGSGMIGGNDTEEMAEIGRKFKNRKIPY